MYLVCACIKVGESQYQQVVLQDIEGGRDCQQHRLPGLPHHLAGELPHHPHRPRLHRQQGQAEEVLPDFGEENHCCRDVKLARSR